VHSKGKIGATRRELDTWVRALPQPRMIATEATIFTGWIYNHLLPHAEKVKVAHPAMLRAIAAAKRKNDRFRTPPSGFGISTRCSKIYEKLFRAITLPQEAECIKSL
jgi:hypothetical protein